MSNKRFTAADVEMIQVGAATAATDATNDLWERFRRLIAAGRAGKTSWYLPLHNFHDSSDEGPVVAQFQQELVAAGFTSITDGTAHNSALIISVAQSSTPPA